MFSSSELRQKLLQSLMHLSSKAGIHLLPLTTEQSVFFLHFNVILNFNFILNFNVIMDFKPLKILNDFPEKNDCDQNERELFN